MNKLDGIKAGDRVRVTFEGVVQPEYAGVAKIEMDGARTPTSWWATPSEIASSTFTIEKIEKIEPPIAVGDRVTGDGRVYTYEVVAIKDDLAFLWNAENLISGHDVVANLRRVPS